MELCINFVAQSDEKILIKHDKHTTINNKIKNQYFDDHSVSDCLLATIEERFEYTCNEVPETQCSYGRYFYINSEIRLETISKFIEDKIVCNQRTSIINIINSENKPLYEIYELVKNKTATLRSNFFLSTSNIGTRIEIPKYVTRSKDIVKVAAPVDNNEDVHVHSGDSPVSLDTDSLTDNIGVQFHNKAKLYDAQNFKRRSLEEGKMLVDDSVYDVVIDTSDTSYVMDKFLEIVAQLYDAGNFSEMQYMLTNTHHSVDRPPLDAVLRSFGIGLACYKQQKYDEALEHIRESEGKLHEWYKINLHVDPADLNDISCCRVYMGNIEMSQGNYHSAIDHFNEAVLKHRFVTSRIQQCYHLSDVTLSAKMAKLALAFRCVNRVVESEKYYKKALLSDDVTLTDIISVHISLGNLLHSVGDNEKAVEHYLVAIEKAEQSVEEATKKIEKESEDEGSNYEYYIQKLNAALSLTWAHGNIGNTYLSLGKKEQAIHHLEECLQLTFLYEPTPSALSRALNNLGTASQTMSKLDEAESYYDEALAQAIYGDDAIGQARAYGNIGNLHMIKKKYEKAIPHYTEVLKLSKDRSTVYVAYHNRGCSFFELAEKRKLEFLGNQERNAGQFVVFGAMSRDLESKHHQEDLEESIIKLNEQGLSDLRKVIKNLESTFANITSSPQGRLDLFVSLFETNVKTFVRAQDCAYNVREHHTALVFAEQARARTLGEILLKRKSVPIKSPLSIDGINSIMERVEPYTPVVVLSYTGTRLLGWVLVFDGNKVSLNGFEQEPKSGFFEDKSLDMYLRYSLGEELTSNIDLYGEEKWSNVNSFDCGIHMDLERNVKDGEQEVQVNAENAVTVEKENEEKCDKEKGDNEQCDNFEADKNVSSSSACLQEMSQEASSNGKSKQGVLSELHKYITAPIHAILKSALPTDHTSSKIILVPDSSTKMIPFAALRDNDSGSYFGDSHIIQFSPSLLVLGIMNHTPSSVITITKKCRHVLIVGDPCTPPFKFKDDEWILGDLPYARSEAQWVGHYMRTAPLIGEEPTKEVVISLLRQAKLIHLATHGSATHGFLVLAGNKYNMQSSLHSRKYFENENNLLLYTSDVQSLQLQPSLVILSSCDSGRGIFRGDDIQGIARAFLLAGAEAVMTSIWKVPDQSASFFMQFFYRYMLDGYSSSEALQKAVLSVRSFVLFSQYIHWGGYQLTGNNIRIQADVMEEDKHVWNCLNKPNGCSPFPRLDILLSLEQSLLSSSGSDVQVLWGPGGVDATEVVSDFISKHHDNYRTIIWLNAYNTCSVCMVIEDIKKIVDEPMLIVVDNATVECLSHVKHLVNKASQLILITQSLSDYDNMSREVDKVLLRGVNIPSHIPPLSNLQVTQRLVYHIMCTSKFAPNKIDQHNINYLATFCSGSPVLVHVMESLIDCIATRYNGDITTTLSELTLLLSNNAPTETSSDDNDFICKRTVAILRCLSFSASSLYFLYCLSTLAGVPVPYSLLKALENEIECNTDELSEISCINKLKLANCLVPYPYTVIASSHPVTESTSLYYVPDIISDTVWHFMMSTEDQIFSIGMVIRVLKKLNPCLLLSCSHYFYDFVKSLQQKFSDWINGSSYDDESAEYKCYIDLLALEDVLSH